MGRLQFYCSKKERDLENYLWNTRFHVSDSDLLLMGECLLEEIEIYEKGLFMTLYLRIDFLGI